MDTQKMFDLPRTSTYFMKRRSDHSEYSRKHNLRRPDMTSRRLTFTLLVAAALLFSVSAGLAKDLKPVKLPEPDMAGGKPLMQALKERRSVRDFTDEKINEQVLSNLLWAAFGINRPEDGKRTAPSAMNWQEIDIYVALEEGLYLYDAPQHTLKPVLAEDVRAQTGIQRFAGLAPLNLVFVADYSKISDRAEADLREFYTAADCGFISQNVYLFCASEGLGTVVRAYVDREALSKTMQLRDDQRIILAQSVGYEKERKEGPPGTKR
jgi:SagB-type dehydrogenase family enzyme